MCMIKEAGVCPYLVVFQWVPGGAGDDHLLLLSLLEVKSGRYMVGPS